MLVNDTWQFDFILQISLLFQVEQTKLVSNSMLLALQMCIHSSHTLTDKGLKITLFFPSNFQMAYHHPFFPCITYMTPASLLSLNGIAFLFILVKIHLPFKLSSRCAPEYNFNLPFMYKNAKAMQKTVVLQWRQHCSFLSYLNVD